MDIDPDIANWMLDFLLRLPLEDRVLKSLLRVLPLPSNNPNLQKLILLNKLQSQVSTHSISECTLELLEQLEEIEFRKGNENASDAMRHAYCAVAVKSTVKALGSDDVGDKVSRFDYFKAVKRLWKTRFGRMEKAVGKGGLISEALWTWKDEIEAAVWDDDGDNKVVKKSEGINVVEAVDAYLRDEREKMGPSFLELVASKVKGDEVMQGMLRVWSVVGIADMEEPLHNAGSMEDHRNSNRDDMKTQLLCWDYSTEVDRIRGALRSSLLELQAVVKDPLPEALEFAKAIFTKEGEKKDSGEENCVETNVVEGGRDDHAVGCDARSENHDPVEENSAEVNKSIRHPDPVVETSVKGVGVDETVGCDENNVPGPSLMKSNAYGCTYEWDDSIDDPKENPTDCRGRQLHTPLRKRYTSNNLKGRRKGRKWSLLEEDTLRTAVQKYGRGNWKFILTAYKGVFEDRTEVDLKDKWRNMTR